MKKQLAVLSMMALPFSANANWWNNTADIGNWGVHEVHPDSKAGLVSLANASAGHPVRAGAQSIRFVRTRGGCLGASCEAGSQRTELNASGVEYNGEEKWYAWSIYHKDYQWLGGNVAPLEGQFKALSGPLVMDFRLDYERGLVATFDHFEGWNPTVIIPKSRINNRWHDIRVHAKWSSGADGIFQIWVNGELKVDRRGANFAGDAILFRYGVYAPEVVFRTSNDPTQVVYYDEVMKGATCQSVSKFMPCPGAPQAPVPTVNVKVENVAFSRDDYQGRYNSEVDYAVTQFSDAVVFNRDAFSFKDYKHFVAYETSENRGMMLGISGNTDVDKHIESPVGIGWLFDDFALMVANDNSILGFEKSRMFDYKNPTTTYVNLGYRKQLMDNVMLYSDLLYAYGDSRLGENVTLSDIHALGFNAKLNYTPLENHNFVFSFDMPLHIESGYSKFVEYGMQGPYNLNVDMSPEGRHMDFGIKHIYQLTNMSMFSTEVHYINDADHRQGKADYSAMAKYNLSF